MYFPFNYFLITQLIMFPKVKSLQSNTLKSPSLSESAIFFVFFSPRRLLEGSEMC